MGCEHAPYCKIEHEFDHIGDLINPFPILHKGTYTQIKEIIHANPLLAQRTYTTSHVTVASLLTQYNRDITSLLYGNSENNGYPISEVLQAVAYVIADDNELFGNRPKGYAQIVKRHSDLNSELTVEIRKPDLLTPLIIISNDRGALIGARNPEVYQRLVTRASENTYKLLVRQINEEDL